MPCNSLPVPCQQISGIAADGVKPYFVYFWLVSFLDMLKLYIHVTKMEEKES